MGVIILLFEKKQKDFVHFSHAREKEPKSALPPRPLDRGMQTENCRNRQFSVGFGKPGRRLVLFYRLAHKS